MARCGECTLAACWFRRSAETDFVVNSRDAAEIVNLQGKFAKMRPLRQYAASVRSPEIPLAHSLLFQVDAIRLLVGFLQAHLNLFVRGGGQIFPDVIGTDRQLAMAAVDEYSELNTRWPAE